MRVYKKKTKVIKGLIGSVSARV